MSADGHETEARLEISLGRRGWSVSALSSLLRVLQAALREFARSTDRTRELFIEPSRPLLRASAGVSDDDLVLSFSFEVPGESEASDELSRIAFDRLMSGLSDFIKVLPQKGLWGETVASPGAPRQDSATSRRLDELRMELRRFPRVRLRHGARSILFEGDRMEIH